MYAGISDLGIEHLGFRFGSTIWNFGLGFGVWGQTFIIVSSTEVTIGISFKPDIKVYPADSGF